MLFVRQRSHSFSSFPSTDRARAAVVARTGPKLLAGTRFASPRTQQVAQQRVELIGACVMMTAFLMLALFA